MLRIAFRELVSTRTASLVAATGLLVATLGFIVLASTSQTAEASLRGDINRAWSTPYDLLVRPPGNKTALEVKDGLVRPNFLDNIKGGITISQLDQIRQVAGVRVAAPLAVMGFVQWPGRLDLDLSKEARTGDLTVFRVSTAEVADAGLSTYPPQSQLYVVVKSTSPTVWLVPCASIGLPPQSGAACFGPTPPSPSLTAVLTSPPLGHIWLPILLPVVIAGIDPGAEAQIAGINRCVTSGRYLSVADAPHDLVISKPPAGPFIQNPEIPVLASTRTFTDATWNVQIDESPDGSALLNGARGAASGPAALADWVPMAHQTRTADQLYEAFLPKVDSTAGAIPQSDPWPIWTIGGGSYDQTGPSTLQAKTADPGLTKYQPPATVMVSPDPTPPEIKDTAFESITEHQLVNDKPTGTIAQETGVRSWDVVGAYNPDCVPGFNPLAGGHLEAYSYPAVRLSNGRLLGPNRSLTGYVSSPPLLLTTLAGAQFFADPGRFEGMPGDAFISVVRVKVTGVGAPGPLSQARLTSVASRIHQATGLDVDIVKGSSPETVRVTLPAGKFGRPALDVTEQWSVKGVATRFVEAISAQNLVLFGLVLVAAMGLVGQTSYMAARRRRVEFGVLRALGWPAWRIGALVEVEMLILGLVVGLLALVAGVGLAWALHLQTGGWQWAAAVPLALGMAGLAALLPAVSSARGRTVEVMRKGGRQRESRPVWSVMALGVRELLSAWRAEAMLGVAAIALGSAALGGILLIEAGFRGQLDATVLGHYLGAQVQPFHIVLAAMTLVIGALAAGEIVTLSYLERQPHLATLRALGWSRWLVVRLLAGQALLLGLVGGLTSAALVTIAGVVLDAPVAVALMAGGASLGVALLATLLAVIVPFALAHRLAPASALREE